MDITVTKLKDLIPYLEDGTRLCIRCKYQNKDYQNFYGKDILKLPWEIINTLTVENIGVRLDMFPDGITPTLVISASDKSEIITIDHIAMAAALGMQPKDTPKKDVPNEITVSFYPPEEKSGEHERSLVDRINRMLNSLLQLSEDDEDEMDEDN